MNSRARAGSRRRTNAEKQDEHVRIAAWRQLLERCGRKATRKRVHGLRVVTLRILAEAETRLPDQNEEAHPPNAAARWTTQAEKLRQALGPVRETDVWLQKLAGLRRSVSEPVGSYHPRSSRECLRQIDRLEEQLDQERRASEKKLTATIESRRGKLERLSEEMEAAWQQQRMEKQGAARILEQFAGVAAQFPELNAENLHDFRKSIKGVRYRAEIRAARDAEAGKLAKQIKKMQSSIGEWHDWQALAKKARRGARGKRDDLAELLETLTAESLGKALEVCRRVTERLMHKRRAEMGMAGPAEPKLPVRREVPEVLLDQSRFA